MTENERDNGTFGIDEHTIIDKFIKSNDFFCFCFCDVCMWFVTLNTHTHTHTCTYTIAALIRSLFVVYFLRIECVFVWPTIHIKLHTKSRNLYRCNANARNCFRSWNTTYLQIAPYIVCVCVCVCVRGSKYEYYDRLQDSITNLFV